MLGLEGSQEGHQALIQPLSVRRSWQGVTLRQGFRFHFQIDFSVYLSGIQRYVA